MTENINLRKVNSDKGNQKKLMKFKVKTMCICFYMIHNGLHKKHIMTVVLYCIDLSI